MVVANWNPAALELYTLPVQKSDTGPTPMTKVVALGLPSIAKGCCITFLGFRNLLPKSIFSRMRQQLHDASVFAKPFASASPDIISVAVTICDERGSHDTICFVVHSSTLRHHARVISQDTIPWQMWGPTTTRWYPHPTINVCGQQCLLTGPTSKEIWDFNQYRVRCLGQGFAIESEAACVSVETEPSCVKSPGLEGGVYSSLPYVKLVLKQLENIRHGMTCLDDDRIFCERVSPRHSSPLLFPFLMTLLQQYTTLGHYEVDQLYFG
jgi:hypothetical protein